MDSAEHIYIGAGGSQFAQPYGYSLYSTNGTIRWAVRLTCCSGLGGTALTPALSPDESTVYFHATTGVLLAVDSATGTIKWNVTTAASPRQGFYAAPLVDDDGNIYVAGADGGKFNVVQAVSPAGTTLWVSDRLGGQPATMGWSPKSRSIVFGCDTDGSYGTTAYIYALHADSGDVVWSYESNTTSGFAVAVNAAPTIDANRDVAYISVDDGGDLLAFDIPTGKLMWTNAPGPASDGGAAISADGDHIFFYSAATFSGSTSYNLVGAFASNGSVFWSSRTLMLNSTSSTPFSDPPHGPPTVTADGQVLACIGGTSGWGALFAFTPEVGSLYPPGRATWSYSFTNSPKYDEMGQGTSPILQADNTIYVGDLDLGSVWKLKVAA